MGVVPSPLWAAMASAVEPHPQPISSMAIAALTAPAQSEAQAQTYPQRVVRIVNPFPPGGSVDTMARILAQKLSERIGQQVVVENRPGAGGTVGSVARRADLRATAHT